MSKHISFETLLDIASPKKKFPSSRLIQRVPSDLGNNTRDDKKTFEVIQFQFKKWDLVLITANLLLRL